MQVANEVETEQVVDAGMDYRTGQPLWSSMVQVGGMSRSCMQCATLTMMCRQDAHLVSGMLTAEAVGQ